MRGLAERAGKTAAHPFTIAETRLFRDFFNRQTSLLQHEAGGFEAKVLYGLGGRAARLCPKNAAELAGTEPGGFCKLLDRKRFAQIRSGVSERILHTVGFCVELEER